MFYHFHRVVGGKACLGVDWCGEIDVSVVATAQTPGFGVSVRVLKHQ